MDDFFWIFLNPSHSFNPLFRKSHSYGAPPSKMHELIFSLFNWATTFSRLLSFSFLQYHTDLKLYWMSSFHPCPQFFGNWRRWKFSSASKYLSIWISNLFLLLKSDDINQFHFYLPGLFQNMERVGELTTIPISRQEPNSRRIPANWFDLNAF